MTTTSEPSAAIEALGLGKAFGAVKAVGGLDLSVPSGGEIFGLLGQNGPGKPGIGI
ncbi:MAG: hypothetical protein WAK58_24135 [Trebonia sp.]